MNYSPFGMAPSSLEHNTGNDLHVDILEKRSEDEDKDKDIDDLSDKGLAGVSFYEEGMSVGGHEEEGEEDQKQKHENTKVGQEEEGKVKKEKGDSSGSNVEGGKTGLGILRVGQGENDSEGKERRHSVVRGLEQQPGGEKKRMEKISQEKPKAVVLGSLSRTRGAAETHEEGASKRGVGPVKTETKGETAKIETKGETAKIETKEETTNIETKEETTKIETKEETAKARDETKHGKSGDSQKERKTKEDEKTHVSSGVESRSQGEGVGKERGIKGSIGLGRESKEEDRKVQDLSSGSLVNSSSTGVPDSRARTNDTLVAGRADTLEKTREVGEEHQEEGNAPSGSKEKTKSAVGVDSISKEKPKSLKKASSRSKRRSSDRTDDTASRRIYRETGRQDGSETSKPSRLGSSRGDSPRSSELLKTGTPRQGGDLGVLSEVKDESGDNGYRCLNARTAGIFELFGGLSRRSGSSCPSSSGRRVEKRVQGEAEGRRGRRSRQVVYHEVGCPYSFWLEIVGVLNKIRSELGGHSLASQKTSAEDVRGSSDASAAAGGAKTGNATQAVKVLAKSEESGQLPAKEGVEIRSLASVEKEREKRDLLERAPAPRPSKDAGTERSSDDSFGGSTGVFKMMKLLACLDSCIRGLAERMLHLNEYAYGVYTRAYRRRVLSQARVVLGHLPIVNKSEIQSRDGHFLGAYTLLGSLMSVSLLLVVVGLGRWSSAGGGSDGCLEEAETLKKLGQVGGKIKMLSSHISNSERGVETVVLSDDPGSICRRILESREATSRDRPCGEDSSGCVGEMGSLSSMQDLTVRLEENNEILLHLSEGLAKCAQSLAT